MSVISVTIVRFRSNGHRFKLGGLQVWPLILLSRGILTVSHSYCLHFQMHNATLYILEALYLYINIRHSDRGNNDIFILQIEKSKHRIVRDFQRWLIYWHCCRNENALVNRTSFKWCLFFTRMLSDYISCVILLVHDVGMWIRVRMTLNGGKW